MINEHKKTLMNGKMITDKIAEFEGPSNDLKSFHSILAHYGVTSRVDILLYSRNKIAGIIGNLEKIRTDSAVQHALIQVIQQFKKKKFYQIIS